MILSPASDIVHPNITRAFPKWLFHGGTTEETQLTANNLGILFLPAVITHRAPLTVMVNLHATLVGTIATNQSDA